MPTAIKKDIIMYRYRYLFIIVMLFIVTMPIFAQSGDVDVDIPDIPAGQQVTITYRVRVNEALPIGTQFILDQGRVTVGNETILTDDPRITGNTDITRTLAGLSAKALPATGETPWWRTIALIAGVAVILAGVVTMIGRKISVRA
jgi:hypothetical protein